MHAIYCLYSIAGTIAPAALARDVMECRRVILVLIGHRVQYRMLPYPSCQWNEGSPAISLFAVRCRSIDLMLNYNLVTFSGQQFKRPGPNRVCQLITKSAISNVVINII